MSALAEALPVVAAHDGEPAGRIDVRDRVLAKVARAASAEAIGVPADTISAHVSDVGRGLAVRLRAPLPMPDLDDDAAVAAAVPLLERARGLQDDIRGRITALLGREVALVDITIAGAVVETRRRVR
ncbi:hypothetical protein [Microbacterium gilvum]|uniref:NTP pyrophosphohydrolase n=1 Tax=Microbacterium gilvum TaxID=1336204 RepID=A0ABP9A4B9_9MICO